MLRLMKIGLIAVIFTAAAIEAVGGTITGKVTDQSSAAIANCKVRLYEYPPEDDDEIAEATTDSSGNYTIPGVPAGQYIVAAFPCLTSLPYINQIYNNELYYMEATPVSVTASGTTSNINFQLQPSGMITGTVTDASTGQPIPGVWIYADNYDDEDAMFSDALTDEDGVYRMTGLPPGDYRLEADSEESGLNYCRIFYNQKTSWNLADRVTLTGTETVSGINFALTAGGAISGTVTDSSGNPIEGLWVHAYTYNIEEWAGEGDTDANGFYTISGLANGTYRVKACPSCEGDLPYADEYYNDTSWKDATAVSVSVGQTTTGIDFVLAGGTSISGTITGWDAASGSYIPLEGAQVSAENLTTGYCCGWAMAEADGTYIMGGLPSGAYRVRASADGYAQEYYPDSIDWGGSETVEVSVGSPATGIDFQLDIGGQISGTITDQDTGLPITENVWVSAQPATGEPWGTGTNQIESDGSYTITGLPAGTYKVTVRADGYDEEFYNEQIDWMLATPVEVTVGQTTTGINFTPSRERGGKLIGFVTLPDGTPVPNAWVNANGIENMRWKGDDSEPNGFFTLTGITPGQWRLRANPPMNQDYLNYSESEEITVIMPPDTNEVNVGQIILPSVNLVGMVKLPDGSPSTHSPVSIEKVGEPMWMFTGTDQLGYFRKGGLSAGTYRIRLEIPWGQSGIMRPDPCTVEITDPNVILDVGVLTYATASKHITGQVVREDSNGVANVQVNAFKRGADGWANTQTNSDGEFSLDVAAGTWEIMIHPSPQQQGGVDWVYTGYPEIVSFSNDNNEETKNVTFTVNSANSRITGFVVGPNGESLRQGGGWIDIRDDSGKGNGAPLDNGGAFNIAVKPGTYNVWVGIDKQTYPYWSSPRLNPVKVEEDETVNLGAIQLVSKNSGIQGTVTRSSDGAAISGIRVNAWQRNGGWADTTTDNEGNYRLSLIEGTWEVSVDAQYNSEYISGQPPRTVIVPEGSIITDIDFQLQQASGSIAVSLLDSEGTLLTDIDNGWAYAREGQFSMQPVAGAPVSNGQATIKLTAGEYVVGVFLPPNSGYSMPGEQTVTVEDSEVDVNIILLTNNSAITGTFYTDADKTQPAVGISGEVFANQKMGGVWQSTPIDSTDGTYTLRVAPGDWNIGYHIRSAGYINNPPPDSRVTVGSGQTETYDFVLAAADATIQGTVLDPNGNPLTHAWVWAHSEGDGTPGSRIDNGSPTQEPDGSFSINVPSGRQYEVGSNAPSEWGYIQPDLKSVTPASGQTVTVTLQYKQSNAVINGTVYYKDVNNNNIPCEYAWVNAWSDNGQHSGTGTDEDGNFQINVSKNTTWHLEAFYHPKETQTFYRSREPEDITVNSASVTASIEVSQYDRELPPPISAMFDPNVGWSNTLGDGTRIEIPAGAIPADGNVCISFSPIVDELQSTATDEPIGWGYAITLSEQETGTHITDNFNTNVLITFSYRDEDLNEMGLTEDDISPAYYSTTTNSWTKVESFTVDKDANTVTVQVNHFSTWALTGGRDLQAQDDGPQNIDMTITKCTIKAGKTQGQDSFDASGTFAETLSDFNDINSIDVNIIALTGDGGSPEEIYTESIAFNASQVVGGKYKYSHKLVSGQPGFITSLAIDFNKKTFTMKSKNIDLTGLECPLQLNVKMGDYTLSGDADETIVNGSKLIPIRLMRTHADTLRIKSAKAKASTTDSFTVKGEIAVEAVDDVNLFEEEMIISWGDTQTFTIPAGNFIQTSATAKAYKCSNVVVDGDAIANCKFDLDKCTFQIAIKNADLDATSGAVDFGISFADFDESASLNLP